jgi:uncharacterized membrane-anchored protein
LGYFAVALIAFLIAHIGGAAFAKYRVAEVSTSEAFREALPWLGDAFSWLFLFAPFIALAFVSACFSGWARARGIIATFALGLGILCYFYIDQHYWARVALQQERWTASALAVGLAPIFIGIPVFLGAFFLQGVAAALDPRKR